VNLIEIKRSLTTLRMGGAAQSIETRILQAQTEKMTYLDFARPWSPMN